VWAQDGKAVPAVTVQLLDTAGHGLQTATSDGKGQYRFSNLPFGTYRLKAELPGQGQDLEDLTLASGEDRQADLHLAAAVAVDSDAVEIRAQRSLISRASSSSRTEISSEQIDRLPGGQTVSLPKLLVTTNPGMIQGPFGQIFTRGNHANLQYQIDGIQLPDSLSGTFGDAFSPANIDRMEVITGGIPAEYGNRMAGVVNIVTKSGARAPGGWLGMTYGSYGQASPEFSYGGSNGDGSFGYFLSGSYSQTDRGLDTPEPASESQQDQGGKEAIHDHSSGNDEFAKLDWRMDRADKVSLVLYNEQRTFEIPNYPSSFLPTDPFFSGSNADGSSFVDAYGNGSFNWAPPGTNDSQSEANAYAELVWRHELSDQAWLQLAPYWKYSAVQFNGDPANDLADAADGGSPNSFEENRRVNNAGLKGDSGFRGGPSQQWKAGFQLQGSQASGPVSVTTVDPSNPAATLSSQDDSLDKGFQGSLYVQDEVQVTPSVILNAGLRYDATQVIFADAQSFDSLWQPRMGLSWMATPSSKLHLFYGRLFQPAPAEDLRDTFNSLGAGQLSPYDIKAEKDNYYESGLDQQWGRQVLSVNVYYKDAVDMLDDTQLLNTAISQPYNFSVGYAYGTEVSVQGKLSDTWSDTVNYSYEIAEGRGINGGIFAFPSGTDPGGDYQFLDHVQIHTVNGGLNFSQDGFWAGLSGLFGSGLRTGPNNTGSLPAHVSFDGTLGYAFSGSRWWSDWKLSGDVLNVFDNAYPITVANGYNGSHYAAGREFLVHLSKAL
jgi:outer membrane receptor protein involved in Fe transport